MIIGDRVLTAYSSKALQHITSRTGTIVGLPEAPFNQYAVKLDAPAMYKGEPVSTVYADETELVKG